MNITSLSPISSFSKDYKKMNQSKIDDIRKIYMDSLEFKNLQVSKPQSKSQIRIRSNSRSQSKRNPILEADKPIVNNLLCSDSESLSIQESKSTCIKRELTFLREIIRKKQPEKSLSLSQMEEGSKRKEDSQSRPRSRLLEGHAFPTGIQGSIKDSEQYQYYDGIVKDLIQEMKLRRNPQKTKRPSISPNKYELSKCRKPNRLREGQCNFKSALKLNPKKDSMVFRMTEFLTDSVYEKKISAYALFLYKINYTNNIYVDLSFSCPNKKFKVKVGKGNNCELIKGLIKRRFWFQLAVADQPAHFLWTQATNDAYHQQQKKNNNKSCEIQGNNFSSNCRKTGRKINTQRSQLNRKIMCGQNYCEIQTCFQNSNNGAWSIFRQVSPQSVTNHIPHNFIIGSKNILFLLMTWYYRDVKKMDPFTILPKTYHLSSGETSDADFKEFLEVEGQQPHSIWIVKPGENTNRGHGINVVSVKKVSKIVSKRELHRNGSLKTYIVQKYLKPFLYNGRKFDIRHYLLITSVNGFIKAYWFKEGYLRTCSEKYQLDNLSNQFVHLTNDAIQKKSEAYGKYEPGNKVSYANFQRYLTQNFPHRKYSFEHQILSKIKQITRQMMEASFTYLDPMRKQFNFQLFGMDFMIDSKFKPYLIEVNANPCLETSCPLLERIIPVLVQHTFRIGLDPLFPPPQHYPPVSRYNLSDRILQKLKYELIFDEKSQAKKINIQISAAASPFTLPSKSEPKPDEQTYDNDGEQLQEISLE